MPNAFELFVKDDELNNKKNESHEHEKERMEDSVNKSDLEECTGQKDKGRKRKDDTDSNDSSKVGLGN